MYDYDSMDRVKKVWYLEDANTTTSQAVVLEEYSYGMLADGKDTKTHTAYLNDTEKAVTTYIYDYDDRLVEQVNPDGGRITTEYNANGTVRSTTDANGGSTYFRYDGLNRLTEKWVQQDYGRYMYAGYRYDKAGKIMEQKTGKDTVELDEVPAADRVISKYYEYYQDGKQKSIKDSAGGRAEYQYDADGFLIREDVYTAKDTVNTTEYINNHLGKPVVKKVHVKAGDIKGNSFEDASDKVLITTYTYDKNGNLTTVTSPDKTTTTYEYDSLNRQVHVSQPGGIDKYGETIDIETHTEYDWNGKVVLSTDPKNNFTENTYTKRGFLEKVKKWVITEYEHTEDCITAYTYDRAGRKITEVSPVNYTSIAAITTMNHTEYVYDNMDRVKVKKELYKEIPHVIEFTTLVSKAYKYDLNGNVIKELDGEGYASGTGSSYDERINSGYGAEYIYNLANKVSLALDPVSKDRGLQYSAKYTYDGAGRKVSEENGSGAVTCYTYDDMGNTAAVSVKKASTAPAQVTKSMEYDIAGNLKKQTDGNGNSTTFEYNALGKVRRAIYPEDESIPLNTVTYQYDAKGNLAKMQDTEGVVELFTYDRQGHELTHTVQGEDGKDSITTSKAYDWNGNVVEQKDGNGNSTYVYYDELNRQRATSIYVGGISSSAEEHTTQYMYDKNGNKLKEIDWRGNATTYTYDALGRLTSKADPYAVIQTLEYNHSSVQSKSFDAYGHETVFVYDKNNRLLSTTDSEGNTTRQDYDNAGNVSEKIDGRGNKTKYLYDQFNRLMSVINAKGEKTDYTYDLNGNMISQTDGNRNSTTFEYNAANKLMRKIDHGGRTGVEGSYTYNPAKTESYTYYADGGMKTKVDRNGVSTTYTYDVFNRLILQKAGEESISYTYDDNGNQLSMTDSSGTTRRTYDQLNRAITKSVPEIGTTAFGYDGECDDGEVLENSTDPKLNVTLKIFDKISRLKGVGTVNITTHEEGIIAEYEYDSNGNRERVTYSNGAKEVYSYYSNNLLHTLTNLNINGEPLESFTYEYDGANNQVKVNEELEGTANDRTVEYTYDKGGNRLTELETKLGAKTLTSYVYNEQNRLLSTTVQNANKRDVTKYTYDNNGNMTGKSNETIKQITPLAPPTPHFGMFIPGQGIDKGATEYAKDIAKGTMYFLLSPLISLDTLTQSLYNKDKQRGYENGSKKTFNRIKETGC